MLRFSIHPRDKLTVANRLSLGARSVAYGEKDVPFLGPYPLKITIIENSLIITYDQAITVRSGDGFEVSFFQPTLNPIFTSGENMCTPIFG